MTRRRLFLIKPGFLRDTQASAVNEKRRYYPQEPIFSQSGSPFNGTKMGMEELL